MNTSNSAIADLSATEESTNNYLHGYDETIKAMQPYIDGCKAGKSELMRPAFHRDAIFVAYADGNLLFGPAQIMFDWVDGNGPADDIKPNFASVEILETIAVVRLEVYGWSGKIAGSGVHMSDLFTLIKTEEGWEDIAEDGSLAFAVIESKMKGESPLTIFINSQKEDQ